MVSMAILLIGLTAVVFTVREILGHKANRFGLYDDDPGKSESHSASRQDNAE